MNHARFFRPFLEQLECRLTPGAINAAVPAVASGPGLGGYARPICQDPEPNNDNDNRKNNRVTQDINLGALDYVDVVHTVYETEGVSEYWFETAVTNLSGQPFQWGQVSLTLGMGTGENFTVVPELENHNGLDFDAPDADPHPRTAPAEDDDGPMLAVLHDDSIITWASLQSYENPPSAMFFWFQVDIPDLTEETAAQINNAVEGGYTFTMRLTLDVNEPPEENLAFLPPTSEKPQTGLVPFGAATTLLFPVEGLLIGGSDQSSQSQITNSVSTSQSTGVNAVDSAATTPTNSQAPSLFCQLGTSAPEGVTELFRDVVFADLESWYFLFGRCY